AIQLLGGGWIGYMGVQMLREARKQFKADARIDLKLEGILGTPWRSYRQGLLTNLANPKALLYFAAVIAPFLPPNPSLALSVELIAVLLFTAFVGFGLIAMAVGSKLLRTRMVKAGPYIDAVAGAFFVFAAIALMIAGVRGFF